MIHILKDLTTWGVNPGHFDSKCLNVKKSSSSFVLEIFDSVLIVIILSIPILNCPQSEAWSNISTGQFKYS
jgi:hypothetical protein